MPSTLDTWYDWMYCSDIVLYLWCHLHLIHDMIACTVEQLYFATVQFRILWLVHFLNRLISHFVEEFFKPYFVPGKMDGKVTQYFSLYNKIKYIHVCMSLFSCVFKSFYLLSTVIPKCTLHWNVPATRGHLSCGDTYWGVPSSQVLLYQIWWYLDLLKKFAAIKLAIFWSMRENRKLNGSRNIIVLQYIGRRCDLLSTVNLCSVERTAL